MVYKEEIQVYAASRSCTKPVRSLMLSFASRICGNDTFYNLYIYIHTYMYTHIFTYMYRCTERRNSISLWVHCIAYKEKLHAYKASKPVSSAIESFASNICGQDSRIAYWYTLIHEISVYCTVYEEKLQEFTAPRSCTRPVSWSIESFASNICGQDSRIAYRCSWKLDTRVNYIAYSCIAYESQ